MAEALKGKNKNAMKTVLIINDFTTCEEIALGIQMPILRAMGHKVLPVPSKILNYPLCVDGAVELETADFVKKTLAFFQDRNERIDAVLTGFIPNIELVSVTKEFCHEQKRQGASIFVDPVFGDNGQKYKSVKPEYIEALKELLAVADFCLPNYTEACILTGIPYKGSTKDDSERKDCILGMTSEEAKELLLKLKRLGVQTPIVTGCIVNCRDVIAYLDENDTLCTIEYKRISGHLAGTGDRFAAGFVGRLGNGESIEAAIRNTADEISDRIAHLRNASL